MIIKDVSSGFIDVKSTKDQTTQEAQRCVHEWAYTFGIPHALRTDGGPAFRDRFQDYVDSLGIEHTASSPYNPQSNGLAERGVRQIKDVLRKIKKKPSKDELREWVFMINNHVQSDGSGTAAQRFFRRGVRTRLPNSIVREIDHRQLIQKRHEKQVKIATAKGRTSKDVFMNDDKVVIQDHKTGKWTLKGVISGARDADDGTVQSYTIQMNDGGEFIRNKCFIKHDVWPKTVRFQLNTEADEEVVQPADPTSLSQRASQA